MTGVLAAISSGEAGSCCSAGERALCRWPHISDARCALNDRIQLAATLKAAFL